MQNGVLLDLLLGIEEREAWVDARRAVLGAADREVVSPVDACGHRAQAEFRGKIVDPVRSVAETAVKISRTARGEKRSGNRAVARGKNVPHVGKAVAERI